jgi:hypothetical protein
MTAAGATLAKIANPIRVTGRNRKRNSGELKSIAAAGHAEISRNRTLTVCALVEKMQRVGVEPPVDRIVWPTLLTNVNRLKKNRQTSFVAKDLI